MNNYIQICQDAIKKIIKEESDNIKEASSYMVNAIENDGLIHAVGGHCQCYPIELFYRAGGLVPINPLLPQFFLQSSKTEFSTTLVSKIEDVGKKVFEEQKVTASDCIIASSVSGRTIPVIDAAIAAKEKGIKVIAIQALDFSNAIESGHHTGKFVSDIADVTIDMKVPYGDAVIPVKNSEEKSSPTSSVLGFSILQALVTETVATLAKKGITPPVWVSSNVNNGDEINAKYIEKYKGRVSCL